MFPPPVEKWRCDVTALVRRANLQQHPTSPKVARQFVAETMALWGLVDPEFVDCVRLLASELVTNAVVHARSPAVLTMSLLADVLRVEVRDGASQPPSARTAGPWATSGRGLALVDALSARWGSSAAVGGEKVVWFEVTV